MARQVTTADDLPSHPSRGVGVVTETIHKNMSRQFEVSMPPLVIASPRRKCCLIKSVAFVSNNGSVRTHVSLSLENIPTLLVEQNVAYFIAVSLLLAIFPIQSTCILRWKPCCF